MILTPWMLMLEISAEEDSSPLLKKRSKSYRILVDVLGARRKDMFPNIARPGRTETLSMGDYPPPRAPTVA
jgi:hypothetical protein